MTGKSTPDLGDRVPPENRLPDDEKLYLGDDEDYSIRYDSADDTLVLYDEGAGQKVLTHNEGGDNNARLYGQGNLTLRLDKWAVFFEQGTRGLKAKDYLRTADDKSLQLGTDADFTIYYDSTADEVIIKDNVNDFEIARLLKNGGLKHTPRSSPPSNPEQGVVAMADGVNWDPGSGSGLYVYDGGGWNYLGGAGTV